MNKPKNISILEFKQKVIKIFIHGFLHLLGHDHIKLKDFKKMIKEEDDVAVSEHGHENLTAAALKAPVALER